MSEGMATVEHLKTSMKGYKLDCEFKNFPVTFVNAIRRILLNELPVVVIRDVNILENSTQMPHEMLKHRMEMLPVNVSPEDAATIRDARIEIRIHPQPDGVRTITTDDFVIQSGREKILLRDRDLDTPLLFLRVRPNEQVHIEARLAVESMTGVSHVCTATTKYHVDPERVKVDRKAHIDAGGDPKLYDNFLIQRSYSVNEAGRPNWIDMSIESIGVLDSRVLLRMALNSLRKQMDSYMKAAIDAIAREADEGSFRVSVEQGGHTIGALLQEVIYSDKNVNFVSYDIPHPLRNEMVIRCNASKAPETVLRNAKETIEEYCVALEKVL